MIRGLLSYRRLYWLDIWKRNFETRYRAYCIILLFSKNKVIRLANITIFLIR